MLKAIKIQVYPDLQQVDYINNLMGCSRFIYNKLLEFKINEYNTNKRSVTFSEIGRKLTDLKSEYEWLRDVHSKVLQQSLINLEQAYKNFLKNKIGFPKFKCKHDNKQSCRFPSDAIIGIIGNRISLIRSLKDIHYKCSLDDEKYLNKNKEIIKSATLTKTKSGKYLLSILIDKPITKVLPQTDKIVGIDLGIKTFIITSDNISLENIKIRRNNEKKLIRLHRQLSRKQKNSKNRNKARIKLAKAHEKLTNIKENYLHEVTNQLLNDNQVIVMESLNVEGMMKNHNLAKSLQELSLYRFKEMLRYKAEWYGRDIIEIDKWFPSSKLCNKCKYKNDALLLSDREWKCLNCGDVHDRDLNAALNIRDEGIRINSI